MSYASGLTRGLLGVASASHVYINELGKIIMNLSSTLQILVVEDKKVTSRKSGNTFEFKTAHCVLLDDGGAPVAVGSLRVPSGLDEKVRPGTFRAAFALQVPDWGDQKGEICAVLTDLQPVQLRGAAPAPAASAKA